MISHVRYFQQKITRVSTKGGQSLGKLDSDYNPIQNKNQMFSCDSTPTPLKKSAFQFQARLYLIRVHVRFYYNFIQKKHLRKLSKLIKLRKSLYQPMKLECTTELEYRLQALFTLFQVSRVRMGIKGVVSHEFGCILYMQAKMIIKILLIDQFG